MTWVSAKTTRARRREIARLCTCGTATSVDPWSMHRDHGPNPCRVPRCPGPYALGHQWYAEGWCPICRYARQSVRAYAFMFTILSIAIVLATIGAVGATLAAMRVR